jgi:hypothetical protein
MSRLSATAATSLSRQAIHRRQQGFSEANRSRQELAMDETLVHQILDELISSLEPLETQNAALLQFVKDKGIASDEALAPYLEQASNASNVRWRAFRLRTLSLISSAMKPPQKEAKVASKADEKNASAPEGKAVPRQEETGAPAPESRPAKGREADSARRQETKPAPPKQERNEQGQQGETQQDKEVA